MPLVLGAAIVGLVGHAMRVGVLMSPGLGGSLTPLAPNAGRQPLPEAGATQERTLEAVGCTHLLG